MAINFPSSPAESQAHNVSPGNSFLFRSGSWQPAPMKTALPKNYLVNPGMLVSQQNGDTAAPAGPTVNWYQADQWVINCSMVTGSFNCLRSRPSPSGADWIAIQVVTPVASPTAAAYIQVHQWIEGNKIADLQWGTAAAKQAVLKFSFWSHQAGTYTAVVRNATNDRSFLAPFTFTGGAEQIYSIVIPGDTIGTWPTDTGNGLNVGCAFAAGTTYGGGVAGWQAGNKLAMTGATNGAGLAGGTYFVLSDVGLYLDPYKTGVAPPFVVPSYSDELARCQRYWYKGANIKGACIGTTAFNEACMEHPVPMRIKPVVALSGSVRAHDATNAPTVTSISANQSNRWGLALNNAATPLIAGRSAVQIAESATAYYNVNARM